MNKVAAIDTSDTGSLSGILDFSYQTAEARDLHLAERKWLYLELKAAYSCRDNLPDPLGVVEELYADFDYPEIMDRFVRYMPPKPGDEVGIDSLMMRWQAYLRSESESLRYDGCTIAK